MKVLQPTPEQYEKYKNVLPFVIDSQGRFIIGYGILEDENYAKYHQEILKFNKITL